MARGFGATFGVGTTDEVATTLTTNANSRSYSIWAWRNGDGGATNGRVFGKQVAAVTDVLYFGVGLYIYERKWSTAGGQWYIIAPATGAWNHLCVVYDSSSTTPDPIIYLDGVDVGTTEVIAPSGTRTDNADVFNVGNTFGAVNWDGMLAEFAVWDALLTAPEVVALAKRASPLLVRPQSLVEYVPMVRDNVSHKLAAPTITASAVQPHPPIIYPQWSHQRRFNTAVVASGPFPPFPPPASTLLRM